MSDLNSKIDDLDQAVTTRIGYETQFIQRIGDAYKEIAEELRKLQTTIPQTSRLLMSYKRQLLAGVDRLDATTKRLLQPQPIPIGGKRKTRKRK